MPTACRRLMQAASELGAEALRDKPLPPQACEARRARAKASNAVAWLRAGYQRAFGWKPQEVALLGTAPDGEVAASTGRSVDAVRLARTRRHLPTAWDRRRRREG